VTAGRDGGGEGKGPGEAEGLPPPGERRGLGRDVFAWARRGGSPEGHHSHFGDSQCPVVPAVPCPPHRPHRRHSIPFESA